MRILRSNATSYTVAVSAQDVSNLNRSYPYSNVPAVAVQFDFDSNGLCDIRFSNGVDSSEYDGSALLALSQDAQAYTPKLEVL
jgi:hypothetical protein